MTTLVKYAFGSQFIFVTPGILPHLNIGPGLRVFPACPSLASICKATLLASLEESHVDAEDFVDKHMDALSHVQTENDAEFKESCLESFRRMNLTRSLGKEGFLAKILSFTKDPIRAALWRELLEVFQVDPPRLTLLATK